MKRFLIFLWIMAGSVFAKPPNIVLILSDDSGYSDPGCYGGEIDTPNIDLLAKRGMRLSSFYTNGRCSPSRASLLTGMESAYVGFGGGSLAEWWREVDTPAHRGRLPFNVPTLPELLKQQGYHTMMAGKWHLGGSYLKDAVRRQNQWKKFHPGWALTEAEIAAEFNACPLQRGFDEYFGLLGAEGHFFVTPQDANNYFEGNRKARLSFDRTYSMYCYAAGENDRYKTANHGKTAKAFYDTDGVTDHAIEMIKGAAGSTKPPFLLYLAYRAPHLPLQAPDGLVKKYLKRYTDLGKIKELRTRRLVKQGLFPADAPVNDYGGSGSDELKLKMAVHAAMMDKVDENVGRVLRALERSGEMDNTLILYLSDNGAASHMHGLPNTPYRGSKALLWEGGIKTHFIAVWPGKIEPGTIGNEVAWIGDVAPTLLKIAGAQYPKTFRGKTTQPMDGRNILPMLEGKPMAPPQTLFFNDKGQQGMIYQGRWKFLINPGWYMQTHAKNETSYELYDLTADPAETDNIVSKKPELAALLEKKCREWKKTSGIWNYADILKVRPNDFR